MHTKDVKIGDVMQRIAVVLFMYNKKPCQPRIHLNNRQEISQPHTLVLASNTINTQPFSMSYPIYDGMIVSS